MVKYIRGSCDDYMEKIQNKKFISSLLIFISGCFSVSIANVFGGYFAIVSVIQMIAITIYLVTILEEKDAFKTNLIELILIGLSVVPGLVFFITNDIVGKDVYVGNLSNFWDVCVICSQLISLGSLAYSLFKFAFKFNKNHIEVVDKLDEKENLLLLKKKKSQK